MTNPPDLAPSGQPWAYGIRTWDADGTSYGGFKWDLTPDACTEAADWKPEAECGNGLHANRDGWGDWSLLNMSEAGKIVGIVRWDPAEAVAIDEAKDKARRMWVVMTTRTASLGAVMGFINAKFRERMAREIAAQGKKVKTATKDGQHASAAGDSGHASAAGDRGHASAAGDRGNASAAGRYGHASAAGDRGNASAAGRYGHASAAGDYGHASAAGSYGHASAAGNYGHASAAGSYGRASAAGDWGHASAAGSYGHASAAGYYGHASAAGDRGHASAAGDRGHASAAGRYGIAAALGIDGKAQAAETGAIVLARWDIADGEYRLTRVFAGMVGQTYGPTTIKPATWYALGADGLPVEVTQ